jgi:hypothetical protein
MGAPLQVLPLHGGHPDVSTTGATPAVLDTLLSTLCASQQPRNAFTAFTVAANNNVLLSGDTVAQLMSSQLQDLVSLAAVFDYAVRFDRLFDYGVRDRVVDVLASLPDTSVLEPLVDSIGRHGDPAGTRNGANTLLGAFGKVCVCVHDKARVCTFPTSLLWVCPPVCPCARTQAVSCCTCTVVYRVVLRVVAPFARTRWVCSLSVCVWQARNFTLAFKVWEIMRLSALVPEANACSLVRTNFGRAFPLVVCRLAASSSPLLLSARAFFL